MLTGDQEYTQLIDTAAEPVTVIARLNFFKEQQTKSTVPGGTSVEEIWQTLKIAQELKPLTWINGHPAEAHEVAAPGDVVNIVLAPRSWQSGFGSAAYQNSLQPQPKTWWQQAQPFVGGALGLGAQLLLSFWGRSRQEQDSDTAKTSLAEESATNTGASTPALDGFGGPADNLLPQLTGVANRSNPYGRWIQNLGYNRLYPPKSTESYTYLSGNQEVLIAPFDVGYGPQELSDYRIGDNPIANFPTVSVEAREGVAGDLPFSSITAYSNEKRFSYELTPPGQIFTETTAGEAETVVMDFYFPNGLYKIVQETGANGYVYERREAATVNVLMTGLNYVDITELSLVPFRRSFSFTAAKAKQTVIAVRNSAIDTTGNTVDTVVWTKVQGLLNANPWSTVRDSKGEIVYPARFVVTATASAQLQGQMEQVSVMAKSKVPTWTGSAFTAPAISNNPGWLALHVLRGQANYDRPDDSEIDLDSFKTLAEHCTAKGITYNRVIDTETQAQAVLNSILTICRAKQVERDGKISVIIDKAETQVVQYFTSRNAWGFHWKATRGKTPDCIKVQFVNPDKDWQVDERLVYADGKNETNFNTMQTVLLEGCTDPVWAQKYGRGVLKEDAARRRVYQWYTSIEAVVCVRGDLVKVNHPFIGAGTGCGLIKEVLTNGGGDITGLRIDSRQQMLPDTSYLITVRLKDGTSYSGSVVTAPGNVSTFTLSTPIPAATAIKPERNDLLLFGESPSIARELKVTNIEWTDNFTALISGVDHAPGIYDVDTETVPPFVSNIQRRHQLKPDVAVPVILDLRSDESVLERDTDGGFKARIVLDMESPAQSVAAFEVQIRQAGAVGWPNTAQSFPASLGVCKVEGVEDGVRYDLRVRARRYDSVVSDWNESKTNVLCIGKTTPPPDLPPLELDVETGSVRAFIDTGHGYNMPVDFAGIRWRMHWGHKETWSDATIISQLSTHPMLDVSKYARGLKTFLAKAVDVAGNESVNAAIIVKDYGDLIPDNIVAQFDYHPTFPGTHTGQINGSNELEAIDNSLFYSGDAQRPFWTGNPSALFWSNSFAELTYEFEYKPDRATILKPFKIKLLCDIDSAAYKIEYSLAGGNYFWDRNAAGGSSRFWTTGTNLFYNPSTTWLPMPETGLPGIHGKYKFKITCYANRYKSTIRSVSVIADVPDVIRRYPGLVISDSSAGVAVPIVPGTFRQILYVNPALVLDPSYPNAHAPEVDRSVDPPVIRMRTTAGAYTTGKIDVEVAGY